MSVISETTNQAPKSDSEIYLASLWQEMLDVKDVLLSDKFLEIGGNSLTLNIVLGKIESTYGVAMEPESFFDPEKSSLSVLAKELDALLQQSD